ncbi:MAG TPA: hypothetical protein PKY05_10535 [Fibrobacteria bacterium]|nr:hypothetical protein [Fibrobacteria bacterium]
MKKLALLAAVSFLFVACNEAPKPDANKVDSTVVAKVDSTVKVDSAKVDSAKEDTVKVDSAKKDTVKAEKKAEKKATSTKAK